MDFFLQKICTFVLLAECLVGVAVNVFIAAVQIMKWKAVKSLEAFDQILLCLGISRSLYLTINVLIFLDKTYIFCLVNNLMLHSVSGAAIYLLYFTSFWFTAVLYVYYCVKITNYRHKVFIFLKTRISRLVPWSMVASLLISAAFSIPCAWSTVLLYWPKSANTFYENVTVDDAGLQKIFRVNFIFGILGSSVPFFICCGSTCLLIHSLWRHTRQMSRGGTGFRNPNIEAHVAVVKNMIVFLFIQVIYFGCGLSTFFTWKHFGSSWKGFFFIIVCAPSLLHSAHMIYSNATLNQAFRGMWYNLIRHV